MTKPVTLSPSSQRTNKRQTIVGVVVKFLNFALGLEHLYSC